MSRWYRLTPTDDAFLEEARVRTTQVIEVPVPAETLWAALESDDAVVGWGAGATAMRWVTPRPFGVGTVREVTVAGVARAREHFYRWDEGKRMTFYVEETNRPGLVSMAEDYVVESTPTGSRLTWVVAVKPRMMPGIAAPLASRALGLAIGNMATGLRTKLS